MGERVDGILRVLETTQEDARVARATGERITTILEEQNIITRFSEHKTETRQVVAEIRQDFVAANTRLKGEIDGVVKRLQSLEAAANKEAGARGLAAWIAKQAPFVWTLIGAVLAYLGIKGVPHV